MSLKPNKKGTIAFRNAAENGEFEKCQKIMNQMIKNNVQDKNPKDKSWETVLHGAALRGFHRICKLIMDNVENKCPIAKDGKIPLHWAARQGKTKTIEVILQNITKEQASIQFYKCYICKLEVSMQPRPKTAFENHFASEHGGKEPRGMTPYEYACYKPYADQECKDTFRKYLEISETAERTWAKIAYAERMERDGLIKTDAQFKAYIQGDFDPTEYFKTKRDLKEQMESQKDLDITDQLDSPMDGSKTELEIKKETLDEIEVQRGLEIMDKLDGQNQAQDDFDSKIEVMKEMKKKVELEIVEKLDVGDSDSEFSETEIKDDCKTKLEMKKEALNDIEVQKGIEIMDKLEPPKDQDGFNSKIETKKEMKKKRELEKVEKLDARIKKEIKNFKTEVMKLTEKLDVRIKNEIQNFKNEIEIGIEEEIVDERGTSESKPKIELKPKVEFKFKRIKEEMEVEKGLEIIEKLEPPTKKAKLGQE